MLRFGDCRGSQKEDCQRNKSADTRSRMRQSEVVHDWKGIRCRSHRFHQRFINWAGVFKETARLTSASSSRIFMFDWSRPGVTSLDPLYILRSSPRDLNSTFRYLATSYDQTSCHRVEFGETFELECQT